jgi:KDO2-lipid IV(A) lauroyltransferase
VNAALTKLRESLRTDSAFWRKAMLAGVYHGPDPWVRYSPSVFGIAFGAALAKQRHVVRKWIRRIKGPRSAALELKDVAAVFANYAHSMSEALLVAADRGYFVTNRPLKDWIMLSAYTKGQGVIAATAQTAGWDLGGGMLSYIQPEDVLVVMAREPNANARSMSDAHRMRDGVRVVHVDESPLSSLPLLKHLKNRHGIVALKFDRSIPGQRTRKVRFFGEPWEIPEGPLTLAALSGATIVPVLTRRIRFLEYQTINYPPITLPRKPTSAQLDAAAQQLADSLEAFVREHPTHWFRFQD